MFPCSALKLMGMSDFYTDIKVWIRLSDGTTLSPVDLPVLEVSDTASIDGVQTMSLTLPGRMHLQNGKAIPYAEIIRPGDMIHIEGTLWDGVRAEEATLLDGIVTEPRDSVNLADASFSHTFSLSAESMQYVLTNDTVQYYRYYGAKEGFQRAWSTLNSSKLAFKVDQLLASYMESVTFTFGVWQNGKESLRDVLGCDFKALPANAPIQYDMATQEGSHWSILSGLIDSPLHEMFCVTRDDLTVHGVGNAPKKGMGNLGGRTFMVLRPAPFPYATPDGVVITRDWDALPKHDLTGLNRTKNPLNNQGGARSIHAGSNFFTLYPAFEPLDETMSMSVGISVENVSSIQRVGYRPLSMKTHLLESTVKEQDLIAFSKELTWRVAAQQNRMDEMFTFNLEYPLSPKVKPGEVVRFNAPLGDSTQVFLGYVAARTHRHAIEKGGTTALSLVRCLPEQIYKTPNWFAQGLTAFEINAKPDMPSAKR